MAVFLDTKISLAVEPNKPGVGRETQKRWPRRPADSRRVSPSVPSDRWPTLPRAPVTWGTDVGVRREEFDKLRDG